MPLYEFQCTKCENRFEELVTSAEEEAEITCTACGSTKIFKVMSTFATARSHCRDVGGPPSCSAGGRSGGGGFS